MNIPRCYCEHHDGAQCKTYRHDGEDTCSCGCHGEPSEDIEDSWSELEENWNEDKEP